MFNSDNIYPGVKVTPEEFAQKCDLKIFFNAGKEIELHSMIVNRPGLMLAGYKNDFAEKRVQLMGKTEIGFLQDNDKYIEAFFAKNIPCVVLSRGFLPSPKMKEMAEKYQKTIFLSHKDTLVLIEEITNYLNDLMSPTEAVHGVLMDIYGTGVLLLGKSSIGKSETALELVYRGHRLVADDSVILRRINDRVYGSSPEIIKNLMEIRGVGIIDIKAIYGAGSVIDRKRVELIIELEKWDENKEYERVGKVAKYQTILGIEIPKLVIPVDAGRNLAVVIEVASRDFRLKQSGYSPYSVVHSRMQEDK
ncbi:MAG: HPr(Ser) kinase/phosphatase [Christensenellales bacterium]|nr:HPr(Ser) kinase/phosphatase [Clostridiales bacterium]